MSTRNIQEARRAKRLARRAAFYNHEGPGIMPNAHPGAKARKRNAARRARRARERARLVAAFDTLRDVEAEWGNHDAPLTVGELARELPQVRPLVLT